MKTIYLAILALFLTFHGLSQTNNDCDWEVTNTASNAVIAIQQENSDNYIFCGDYYTTFCTFMSFLGDCPVSLGIFYTDDNGDLQCGGMTQWDNTQSMAIAAWGDDPTTPEKDGFSADEPYTFKLCIDGLGELDGSAEMSTDTPFTACYTTNGFGSINNVSFQLPEFLEFYYWSLEQTCLPSEISEMINGLLINLEDNNHSKHLVKTVDIYGRDIITTNQTGLLIHIYSDLTTSKVYQF